MNLALITQDFPPEIGGIQTYSIELANRFAKKCDSFCVIAPDKPEAPQIDRKLPYPVYRIPCRNPLLGLKAALRSPVIFAKHDIHHAFHAQWQTLPASLFAKKQGIIDNIFATVHARELLFNPFYSYPIAKQAYERYKRWMLKQADLFFPVSEYMADVLHRHGVERDRIKVAINGADPDKFYPIDLQIARQSIDVQAEKVLLSAARLVSRKGIDTTLKAFKKVLKNHPNSCYIIVGEGPQQRYLKQLAIDLNINNAVQFVGKVPHKDLINYYSACDVFVMPSKTQNPDIEGFGIVFLEANACQKPVIGSKSGGIPTAVVDGETGILVEERNPDALAVAINKLFDDPLLAAKMGKNGRRRVLNEANWDVLTDKLFKDMENTI